MENAMKTPAIYRHFFAAALAEVRAEAAAYDADVDDWYTNGDGRPVADGGHGYRFPYCRHGVSTWVDYDCACWQCEDGRGDMDEAIGRARQRWNQFCDMWDWYMAAPHFINAEARAELHAQLMGMFPRNN